MAVVIDALASYVQNMLLEMAKDEIHMLLGVSGEIDKLGIKLKDLKNFLADADRRNITDQTVQAWVRELRDTMYDATDILDLCRLKTMKQGPRRDMGCFNPLLFCLRDPLHAHDIGDRIKNLNQRLDSIKERSATFNFVELASYEDRDRVVPSSRVVNRETSPLMDQSSLVGEKIEADTRQLVKLLTDDLKIGNNTSDVDNKLVVLAIVGTGGIGKTTLAQKIYNDDIIKKNFAKKIWLSVNQDYNQTEMLRTTIMSARADGHGNVNAKALLQQNLKDALEGHKTFLVMDDVWDHRAWEDVLKTPLINAVAQGSRVLVTTRHDFVARAMKALEPYHHVEKLGLEDAWFMLKKQVVGNGNDESQVNELKDVGVEIIKKCDGLPLAVKVMGGLLRQKNISRHDWEKILNDSTWSISGMPEEINYAIYLSYQDLHPSLKLCFLHYSLLPKSRKCLVDDIVGMWISEGFVHGSSCDLEELGRAYYDELILRNLIDPDRYSTDHEVCSMHDVVRSFAQYVARYEALAAHNKEIDIIGELISSQKFIRLSLETNELEWNALHTQTSLRTMIFVGHINIRPSDSLGSFSNLRALHVIYANLDALLESLYELKHLRYLSIEDSNISRLPETIGNMKFLQHICLFGCSDLVKLPDSIAKLQQLRFLNLISTGIKHIPRGFHGLTNLRKLYGFPAQVEGNWCSLNELGSLSQLTMLHISGLENVPLRSFSVNARLGEKVHLRFLRLTCQLVEKEEVISTKLQQIEEVFDGLCPPKCIDNIDIKGYFGRRLPRWMMSTEVIIHEQLRILTIENLPCCTELPNGLCQLPCLELLQIIHAPAIKCVGREFLQLNHNRGNDSQVAFSRLLSLKFGDMVGLEEWKWDERVKAMPVLEELLLRRCKLRRIPSGLTFQAEKLRKLYIYDIKNLCCLGNFASVVHLEVFNNPDLKAIHNFPKLETLIILNCPKINLLESVPVLERLEIEDYNMEALPRYLQGVRPRHFILDCSFSLLSSIAAGDSGPEWNRFSHHHQVRAYATDEGVVRKRFVLYTRDPFSFETNVSRSAISRARWERTELSFWRTCPIEDEWPVGSARANKREPLCLRIRSNAYLYLVGWLCRVCLHCNEEAGIASSSDQWIEPEE